MKIPEPPSVTDFPNVPQVEPTDWPVMPAYVEYTNQYKTSLRDAATLIAMRSAETPAPFIRPSTYPVGWTPLSLSATTTPSFQSAIDDARNTAYKACTKLKIDPLTPLGQLKFKRSLRKLASFRVEHDRLRTLFLEDIRQCKRRYLCRKNGSLIPGAIAFLDIEGSVPNVSKTLQGNREEKYDSSVYSRLHERGANYN